MSVTCPACGSEKIETIMGKTLLKKFNEPVEYQERIDHCLVCEERGDFSGENESRITDAIDIAKKQAINGTLDDLSKMGIKMSYFERALSLPPRTVNRWKNGESSAASIALLRAVRTYPWLLEVADSGFSSYVAKRKLIEGAAQALNEALQINAKSASLDVWHWTDGVSFSGEIVLDPAFKSVDLLQPMISQSASNGG